MSFTSEFVKNTNHVKGAGGVAFARAAKLPLLMKHLEKVARAHLGYASTEKVNWATVDWNALLDFFKQIMPFIMQLITLFGGL